MMFGLGGGGGGSPKSDWRERGITWITPSSMEGVPKNKHSRRHARMPPVAMGDAAQDSNREGEENKRIFHTHGSVMRHLNLGL